MPDLAPHQLSALNDFLEAREIADQARMHTATRPFSVPPARDREISSHNLEEFAERVAKSAIEGFKRPDSTPEEQVRAVVAEEEKKREEKRELEMLRAAEEARKIATENYKRSLIKFGIAIAGSGGLVEAIHQIATAMRH